MKTSNFWDSAAAVAFLFWTMVAMTKHLYRNELGWALFFLAMCLSGVLILAGTIYSLSR